MYLYGYVGKYCQQSGRLEVLSGCCACISGCEIRWSAQSFCPPCMTCSILTERSTHHKGSQQAIVFDFEFLGVSIEIYSLSEKVSLQLITNLSPINNEIRKLPLTYCICKGSFLLFAISRSLIQGSFFNNMQH